VNYGRAVVEREVDSLGLDVTETAGTPWGTSTCPLHDDNSPSFTINMEEGGWKCHAGCGSSGDLAVLVAEVLGEVERDVRMRLRRAMPNSDTDLLRALQVQPKAPVAAVKNDLDYQHRRAPQYIFDRGFTPEVLRAWDVGFDPELGAVVIPVLMDGVLVGLVRRRVNVEPGQAKYDNTRFPKGEVLLGLDHLPFGATEVVVVEGPLDAMWLYQHGIPAVALLGSSMSPTQARLISERFWSVVLAFDADMPGRRGEHEAAILLRSLTIRYARLPEGRDDVQECPEWELHEMLAKAGPLAL